MTGPASPAPRLWSLVGAVILGLLFFGLSRPAEELALTGTLQTLLWPAPALGIALLWHRPVREWPVFLVAAGLALGLLGQRDGLSWQIDVIFAGLGVLQMTLGAWLVRHWVNPAPQLPSIAHLLRYVLLIPGLLAAAYALFVGGLLSWQLDAPWLLQSAQLYAAQALAFLSLLPALLSAPPPLRSSTPPPSAGLALVVPAVLLLGLWPEMPDEVIGTLLALALALVALQLGPRSVSRLNALVILSLVAMSLLGLGPYVPAQGEIDIGSLHPDLIGLSLLSQGLAIALYERRRLAQQMEEARRVQALGFLASGIAHDFNNLLSTIGACAELTADQWPSPPAPAPLQMLESEVQRGHDMTQQLLLTARQGDPQRNAVPIHALLSDIRDSAQALCPPHVQIMLEAPSHETLNARANLTQLRRALHNLLRNAIQVARHRVQLRAGLAHASPHAASHADAHVGQLQSGPYVWIEIQDDGPGIPAEHWPHLFEPFYSTRQGQGGTGLGLAIVAGVAGSHDGAVFMNTHPEQGTVFRFFLPQHFETAPR